MKKHKEIIWFGRGGQGAITASQIVAEAAYMEGYKGITTAPSFGAERRGAPVSAFLRLSDEPIKIFSQIADPDIIVVLDPTLLSILNLKEKYKKEATLIINSTETPDEASYFKKVGVANVTAVALENNLTVAGSAILNTPILGAFTKTSELVSLENIKKTIYSRFSYEKGDSNFNAAEIIYNNTKIYNN